MNHGRIITLAVALSMACSSSECGAPYPRTAPGAELRNHAVAMRVSNDLLQFGRTNLASVLAAKFGVDADGYTNIKLPQKGSFVRVKPDALASHITFGMQTATLLEPGGLRFRIDDLTVGLFIRFTGTTPFGDLGSAVCLAGGSVTINALEIITQPRVSKALDGTALLAANTAVRALDLGALALRATPEGEPSEDCAELDETLQNVSGAFALMGPILNAIFPSLVTAVGNTMLGLLWDTSLELTAMIPVTTLPWVTEGMAYDLAFSVTTQDDAFTFSQVSAGANDPTLGMNLPFSMGVYSERSPCVQPLPTPALSTVVPPAMDGLYKRIDPLTGAVSDQPYHLGLVVSGPYLNTMAHALRNSGILCAAVGSTLLSGSNYVPTAGLLALIAPELANLAPANSPIFFRTVPMTDPVIRFGSGEDIGLDLNGQPMRDSLVNVDLKQLRIQFDLLAWGRFVRAFELVVDVHVGASLIGTVEGRLQVSIDAIAIDNVREVNNPLLIKGYQFTRLAEIVFAIVTNQLGGNRFGFDVPLQASLQQAIGDAVSARVLDVRPEGENNAFLAAYFKLCSTATNDPQDLGCYVPPTPARAPPAAEAALPIENGLVALRVDHAPGVEYQLAVDSDVYGRFTQPSADGLLRFEHPLLRVLGEHHLKLRTRRLGSPLDTRVPVAETTVEVQPHVLAEPAPVIPPSPPHRGGCQSSGTPAWLALLVLAAALRSRAQPRQ